MVALWATALAWAGDDGTTLPPEKRDQAAKNLLIGLRSDNEGLKESCAYLLGQFKIEKAVVPLMDVLHNDPEESTRLVAALALCMIGDARGTYAVKTAATFDNNETVRQRCAWFYNQYVEPGTFRFIAQEPTAPVEYAHH